MNNGEAPLWMWIIVLPAMLMFSFLRVVSTSVRRVITSSRAAIRKLTYKGKHNDNPTNN